MSHGGAGMSSSKRPVGQGERYAALAGLSGKLEGLYSELGPRERWAFQEVLAPGMRVTAATRLGAHAAERVLNSTEVEEYRALRDEPLPSSGGLRPHMVIIMKATRLCNLRCTYCNQWRAGPNNTMSFQVLARIIRDVLRAPGVRRVEFVWHGGEPTLLPMSFFRKAIWLQQQFRMPGQSVANSVQTNGTRLSDGWLRFLRDYEVSVGVSLDGPPEVHDSRRIDVRGRPTSAVVRTGLGELERFGIPHGVLVVVDDDIVNVGARRLLEYLLELRVRAVDLLNVLPTNMPVGASLHGMYLPVQRYVEFLRELFRVWWPRYADEIFVRELAGLVRQLQGGPALTCVFAGNCFGGFLTVDPSGEVSACDKYVGDAKYGFGNIFAMNLADLPEVEALRVIVSENEGELASMRGCPWFEVCKGACPHDRYTTMRHGVAVDGCCGFKPLLEEMARVVH